MSLQLEGNGLGQWVWGQKSHSSKVHTGVKMHIQFMLRCKKVSQKQHMSSNTVQFVFLFFTKEIYLDKVPKHATEELLFILHT